tara:strand:- start:6817 stop:7002 length:186 start_codon:yes stop_codon:yes gene_type:complete
MAKQLNKVTRNECKEAIDYLFVEASINNMNSDERHYTKILLKKVANDYQIKLKDIDNLNGW